MIPALTIALKQQNLPITIEESHCLGFCDIGPNLRLVPTGAFFHNAVDGEFDEIIKKMKKFLEN